MPQLDESTFENISFIFFGLFLTYSAFLYVAVSYSFHKAFSAYYFKFYILIAALLVVQSIIDSREFENKVDFVTNSVKNTTTGVSVDQGVSTLNGEANLTK